eukprot:scaffold65295_cov21-Tisochrysis_lutea.AAC.3
MGKGPAMHRVSPQRGMQSPWGVGFTNTMGVHDGHGTCHAAASRLAVLSPLGGAQTMPRTLLSRPLPLPLPRKSVHAIHEWLAGRAPRPPPFASVKKISLLYVCVCACV